MSSPSTFHIWIAAARLRTLPLSVAGIFTGNALAYQNKSFSWILFLGALLTALSYQVLSNFANDYGDGIKGTDNTHRLGPKRVLQQQWLTPKQLFKGIVLTVLASLVFSLGLIILAFGLKNFFWILIFFALALAAIWSAYNYTVGERAYGYHSLGDVFVFVFFGIVAVCGSFFLQLKVLTLDSFLYAICIGGLSTGVLNLNNLRDIENDRQSNKRTLATLMGLNVGKWYQTILVSGSMLCAGVASYQNAISGGYKHLPMLVIFPLFFQLYQLWQTKDNQAIDRLLKPLALSTFGFSVLLFSTHLIFG
ncbi:MAG: 1,4-dihydroxy-2-naphthoate octaprenyltransferase [Flavobacteriaceae bacterium]